MLFLRSIDDNHNLFMDTSTDTTPAMRVNPETWVDESVAEIDGSTNIRVNGQRVGYISLVHHNGVLAWSTTFLDDSLNGVVEPSEERGPKALYNQEAAALAHYLANRPVIINVSKGSENGES